MKRDYQVIRKNGRGKLSKSGKKKVQEFFAQNSQALIPFVDLIEDSQLAVDELIGAAGRHVIETVLQLSAAGITGPPHSGLNTGDVVRYGSQPGSVTLLNRKLGVTRPRLRKKGVGKGGEVSIPAYDAMHDDESLGDRMLEILMKGVSTRNYAGVIEDSADAVGVSKSSVSRNFIEAGKRELERLLCRRFDDVDILIIYIDGQVFSGHHVISAVGVDKGGIKHVLGIYPGATENSTVVKELLEDLVERGVKADVRRLFVIDGSKALRKAVDAVYGSKNPVQRCRNHKVKNVMDHLPDELKDQVKSVMKAAYRLDWKDGIAKLEKQARWLEGDYPKAAASLREGLEETFTVNRLGLSASLRRCLGTTNLIESPHSGVRMRTRRVSRWNNQNMVMYWCATAWTITEKNFKRIQGYRDLWMLNAVLDEDRVELRREVG